MDNKNQEDLQSRREFFKSAAKAALPVLGAMVLASVPIMEVSASCGKCNNRCMNFCDNTCYKGCKAHCKDNCYSNCTGRNNK